MNNKIMLLAENYGKEMNFGGDGDTYTHILTSFARIFASSPNADKLEINSLQRMDSNIRNHIASFVNNYKKNFGNKLYRINDIFKPISDGDFFFLVFNEKIPQDILCKMYFSLPFLNQGKESKVIDVEWETHKRQLDDILLNKYEIKNYECYEETDSFAETKYQTPAISATLPDMFHFTREDFNLWPEGFFELYGSFAVGTLDRIEQIDFEKREELNECIY